MLDKHKEEFDRWVSLWRDDAIHISDVTQTIESIIAESGTLEAFHASPHEIRGRIVQHVAEYKRTGESSYFVSGTGERVDQSAMFATLTGLFSSAGLDV